VTSPEGKEGLEKVLKLGTQRAAEPHHALHSLKHRPEVLRDLASRVWASRWKEYRRRARDKENRPEIVKQRDARSINRLRKRRASLVWTKVLVTLRAKELQSEEDEASPFHELRDDHAFSLAKESCKAAYLPDFDRPDEKGPFVLRLQPWLTEAVLGYQELALTHRPQFADTIPYIISEEPGTTKPPKNTPRWMLAEDDDDMVDLTKEQREANKRKREESDKRKREDDDGMGDLGLANEQREADKRKRDLGLANEQREANKRKREELDSDSDDGDGDREAEEPPLVAEK